MAGSSPANHLVDLEGSWQNITPKLEVEEIPTEHVQGYEDAHERFEYLIKELDARLISLEDAAKEDRKAASASQDHLAEVELALKMQTAELKAVTLAHDTRLVKLEAAFDAQAIIVQDQAAQIEQLLRNQKDIEDCEGSSDDVADPLSSRSFWWSNMDETSCDAESTTAEITKDSTNGTKTLEDCTTDAGSEPDCRSFSTDASSKVTQLLAKPPRVIDKSSINRDGTLHSKETVRVVDAIATLMTLSECSRKKVQDLVDLTRNVGYYASLEGPEYLCTNQRGRRRSPTAFLWDGQVEVFRTHQSIEITVGCGHPWQYSYVLHFTQVPSGEWVLLRGTYGGKYGDMFSIDSRDYGRYTRRLVQNLLAMVKAGIREDVYFDSYTRDEPETY